MLLCATVREKSENHRDARSRSPGSKAVLPDLWPWRMLWGWLLLPRPADPEAVAPLPAEEPREKEFSSLFS